MFGEFRVASRYPLISQRLSLLTIWVTLALLLIPTSKAHARYASIVIDEETGEVLHETNADTRNHPASLTKMMTLYLTFKALEDGHLTLDQRLQVSRHATSMVPSKLGLKTGQRIRVKDAILSLVTKSANDVAVVLAETLGGTETGFALMMTNEARRLGMMRTRFKNASGLTDYDQLSTARDMATLAIALINDFPRHYHFFSTREFRYQGYRYTSHNNFLDNYDGADGIKTGYTHASGYNLAGSVQRDGRRLVAVVFGGKTARLRDNHIASLLDKGFTTPVKLAKNNPSRLRPTKRTHPVSRHSDDTRHLSAKHRIAWTAETSNQPLENRGISQSPSSRITEPAGSRDTVISYRQTRSTESSPGDYKKRLTIHDKSFDYPPANRDTSDTRITTTIAPASPGAQTLTNRNSPEAGTYALSSKYKEQPNNSSPRLGSFGVQVGAFATYSRAQQAAEKAVTRLPRILGNTRVWVLQRGNQRRSLYLARLIGITRSGADRACQELKLFDIDCMAVSIGSRSQLSQVPGPLAASLLD